MPRTCYAIYDSITGLWLTAYNEAAENCLWGNEANAVCFLSESERDRVTALLNVNSGTSRFIGQNPKPR